MKTANSTRHQLANVKCGFTQPIQTVKAVLTEEAETQKTGYEKKKKVNGSRSLKWLKSDTSEDVMYYSVCQQFPQLAHKSSRAPDCD